MFSPLEKNLKSGPLKVHFQHYGEKIKVFEQNTDIINFGFFFFGGGGGGVISKEKYAANSHEIASEFC